MTPLCELFCPHLFRLDFVCPIFWLAFIDWKCYALCFFGRAVSRWLAYYAICVNCSVQISQIGFFCPSPPIHVFFMSVWTFTVPCTLFTWNSWSSSLFLRQSWLFGVKVILRDVCFPHVAQLGFLYHLYIVYVELILDFSVRRLRYMFSSCQFGFLLSSAHCLRGTHGLALCFFGRADFSE